MCAKVLINLLNTKKNLRKIYFISENLHFFPTHNHNIIYILLNIENIIYNDDMLWKMWITGVFLVVHLGQRSLRQKNMGAGRNGAVVWILRA